MKKSLGLILALLLFFAVTPVQSQVTISSSSDFYALLFQSPSDSRQTVYKAPYVAWRNNTGNPVYSLQADTTSMKAAFGWYQKAWTVAVVDTATINSEFGSVTFRRFAWRAGSYKDTTIAVFKHHRTELSGFVPDVLVNVAPFDSCYRGASFTVGYMTTQFQ